MTRNLKALGLALLAVLALGAVAASGAQAAPNTFHTFKAADKNGNTLSNAIVTAKAESNQVFTYEPEGLPVVCEVVETDTGTVTDGSTEATGRPTYKECEAGGVPGVEVHTDGCHYTFTGATDANEHAEVHLTGCTKEVNGMVGIQITLPLSCVITVTNEQTLNGVHYNNETTENGLEDITIEATVTGIHATANGACQAFFGLAATSNTGTYTGNVRATGDKDNEGVPGEAVSITTEEMATSEH